MKNTLILSLSILLTLFSSTVVSGQHCCSKAGHFLMGLQKSANASRSDSLDIIHTHLYLDMTDKESQQLSGLANISLVTLVDEITEIDFDLHELIVDSVFIDSNPVAFELSSPLLRIYPPSPLAIGSEAEVEIFYHGSPDGDLSGWGGFYFQGDYAFNLGVGFEADPHNYGRAWYPCFDNFVERCTYSFEVLTDDGDTAYCNGDRQFETLVGEDSLLTRWEMNSAIPSYLTNISVAPYTHFESSFSSTSGEEIPIWLTAKPEDVNGVVNSFDNLETCLDAFENDFGPYRWSRVGYVFVPFGAGAMEHATNIAYPLSLAQGDLTYETLMAHELAHHWWGDLVTCESQEEMWINEGMASYCESLFLEEVYGETAYWESVLDNHKDVLLYAHVQDGERLPVSGIGHEHTYGDHVYKKGAVIAHNLRQVMGDAAFFEAASSFLEANVYSDVSSLQMMTFFQDYTEINLQHFFDGWIFQPGFPDYRINHWNSAEVDGLFENNIQVQQYEHYTNSSILSSPLKLSFIDSEGESFDTTIVIEELQSNVEVVTSFDPLYVLINRGDELLQAHLSEERIISDGGIETFSRSEFRLNIDELGTDSLWFRVENHWSESTVNDGSNGLHISNDRFWRIYSDFPDAFAAEARIRFYGDPDGANYFDPKFFSFMDELGMSELDLVLVHRPLNSENWSMIPFELNAQGNENNYQGMINFNLVGSGDYAWAIETDAVDIQERLSPNLTIAPNPCQDQIQLTLHQTTAYSIKTIDGKSVMNASTDGKIDVEVLSPGIYLLVLATGERSTFIKQ